MVLLVSRSLPVAPNYSFLCHTCPAPRLWPYLCPKQLLPSFTLPPLSDGSCQALSCHVPISLISFHPFQVFGLPSSGSAILLSHVIFSFIGLHCSQGVSPFLLPPAARMPAEGALIAQLREHRCSQPGACYRRCAGASHHEQRRKSISIQSFDVFAVNSVNLLVLAKQKITLKTSSHKSYFPMNYISLLHSPFTLCLTSRDIKIKSIQCEN